MRKEHEQQQQREFPTPLVVNFAQIPQMLKEQPAWVVWQYQQVEEDIKKPPFSPITGKLASVSDPTSWSSFANAKRAYEDGQYAGIGFMLTAGIVGIDIDHCIDVGQYSSAAVTMVEVLNTYAEVSPSGEGIRLFLQGNLPGPYRRRGPIELYQDHRYLTVTGHRIAGTPAEIAQRQQELESVYARLFPPPKKENTKMVIGAQALLEEGGVLEKAYHAKNGQTFQRYYEGDPSLWEGTGAKHTSQSEADFTLCLMLLYWTNNDTIQTD